MKRKLTSLMLVAVAILAFSCKKEPQLTDSGKGPQLTVASCPENALMGAPIQFSVTLEDQSPLSTLQVKLLFDETEVSKVDIRTKENGTYEGEVLVPLLKDIPDGTASLVFEAMNVNMGKTSETVMVDISRPNPEALTLVAADGTEYQMPRTADYQYELTAMLPKDFHVFAMVPAGGEEKIKLGWDGEALAVNHENPIPYAANEAAEYTVSLNLLTLAASPFDLVVTQDTDISETKPQDFLQLKQNRAINFTAIPDIREWDIDPDFFKLDEDENVIFRAIDGRYSLTADFENKFIIVEPVDADNSPAVLQDSGDGALWMIGSGVGKPNPVKSWDAGFAIALAQQSPKVYVITLNVGSQITNTSEVKFFFAKGWLGEYKSYTAINDATSLFQVTHEGNIKLLANKSLTEKKAYEFKVDITAGKQNPVLNIREVEPSLGKAKDIRVNGVQAELHPNQIYKINALQLTKNSTITFSGIDNPMEWYLDPDYFKVEGNVLKSNVVDGWYSIELHTKEQYVLARRVQADGKTATFKDDGAIVMMGWGVAHPSMDKQFGWAGGTMYYLAEIEEGKYQFTGKAVAESSKETGGRIRFDYVSLKLFGQAAFGDEMGTAYTIGTNAAALGFLNSGNIELDPNKNGGQKLEEGATYRFTFNFTDKTMADGKFNNFTFDAVKL